MKLTLLLASAMVGAPAFAQETATAGQPTERGRQAGFFLGGGAGSSAIDDPVLGETYGFGELQIRGGYIFNKYLSVSAQAAIPLESYESGNGGGLYLSDDVELNSELGIFLEPRLPLGDVVGLYARVGYISTEFTFYDQFGGGEFDLSSEGIAYGVGIDFDFGRHVTLAFDLTAYDTDFNSAGGAGIIVKGRF